MKMKLVIVFAVFTAIGVGLFFFLTRGTVGVTYDTAEVTKGQTAEFVQDVGVISSRNIRRYYGNGQREIKAMTLELGDYVKAGDVLVRYEDNIKSIDLQIRQVEKQIEALEAAYADAATNTDMERVNSARIEIAGIKDQIETAVEEKNRTETLYKGGAATKVELDKAMEAIERLETNLDLARNTYNQAAKGISQSMREKYEAEIDGLLVAIDILEDSKEAAVITADVDGIVTALGTFEGDTPSAGIMILELQDPTAQVILVDFMTEDAAKVKQGYKAAVEDHKLDIHIDGLEVDRLYPTAFVTLSELGVEENRQTVEIGLPASAETMPFGLEVDTKVMIDEPKEMLLMPAGAVVEKDSKEFVRILIDGQPVEREILTGIRSGSTVEVLEGVSEGEQVILNYQKD